MKPYRVFFCSKINLDEVLVNLKYNKCYLYNKIDKKISFMLGAGVSTAAGIPDFRSQKGIYNNFATKYKLKNPELMFDINFFKDNPNILYDYYSQLPDFIIYRPTFTHV